MKVEFHETVEVTGTATITVADIHSALLDAMADADAEATRSLATARQKQVVLGRFANAIHECLEAISDEAIAAANDELRRLFCDSLRHHADRWDIKTSKSADCEAGK